MRTRHGLILRWWLTGVALEVTAGLTGVTWWSGQWWALQFTIVTLMVVHVLAPELDAAWRTWHGDD